MRLLPALALMAIAISSPAHAMSQMDLPVGYPPAHSYIEGAIVGLAAAAWLLIAGGWFRAPNVVRSLPWAVGCILLMTAQCLALDSDGTEPDPGLTPGAVRTTRREEIVGVNTSTVRNVTGAEKLAVYRRYGMKGPHSVIPGTDHLPPHECDHRVPLCAGGSNDISNLWIQAGSGPWNFHDKDRLEDATCQKLKKGVLTVEQAQAVFLGDWKAGYVAEFGGAPRHE